MSRRVNVASGLLFAVAIVPVLGGLFMTFSPASSEFADEELLGISVSQIRDFSPELVDTIELAVQTRGIYLLTIGLFWAVISLIPYRRGEKWAWYTMLGTGAVFLAGYLYVDYVGVVTLDVYQSIFLTMGIIWLILWIVGLALPAKEILGNPSS